MSKISIKPSSTGTGTFTIEAPNSNYNRNFMLPDESGVVITNNRQLSFRNKIINGNFDIWQRGTSQTSAGYGSADRWNCFSIGSTKTASRQEFVVGQTEVPGNPRYFMRHVVNSVPGAGNYTIMLQRIESVHTFAGKTLTVSFWAKADSNKSIAVNFQQDFGTGGSPSPITLVIVPQKVALTTVWTKHVLSIAVPSIVDKTLGTDGNDYLQLNFWFEAGANFADRTDSLGQQSGTFDIAQVQVEGGEIATPFEERHIADELALCQRYYEKGYFQMSSADVAPNGATYGYIKFCAAKRTTSTVLLNNIYLVNSISPGIEAVLQDGAYVNAAATTANTLQRCALQWTADSEL